MAYEMVTLNAKEHDDFVESHKYGELNQIYRWQYVRKGWIGKNIGVKKDDRLIGACLILLERLPILPHYFVYAPKGPVVDYESEEDLKATIQILKDFCEKNKVFPLKFDPQVSIEIDGLVSYLKNLGCCHYGLERGLEYSQPRCYMVTDIDKSEKDVMNSLQSRTKSAVKESSKNSLECQRCDKGKLPKLSELMEITAKRDEFNRRGHEYFESLYDVLGPDDDCELYLTRLISFLVKKSSGEELNQIDNQELKTKNKLERDITEDKKNNFLKKLDVLDSRRKRCKDLIEQMNEYIQNGVDEIVLSGALLAFCGKKSYCLYGASSNDSRGLGPNYLMQWTVMKGVIEKGCMTYDFGGISGYTPKDNVGDHEAGLYEFKKRFGTEMLTTIGEFGVVFSRFISRLLEFTSKHR